jgi:hypothetical protein
MKDHNTVCLTTASYRRMAEIAGSRDLQAFARYMLDPANGCSELDAGAEVIVEENDGGLVRVRRRGSPTSGWTDRTMISQ